MRILFHQEMSINFMSLSMVAQLTALSKSFPTSWKLALEGLFA
jgi:hypothetical protein